MQVIRERRLRPGHSTAMEGALQLVEWPLQQEQRYDVLWVQAGADGELEETRLTREPLALAQAERIFDEAYAHRRAAGDVALDGDEAAAFPAERLPPPLAPPPPPPPGGAPTSRRSRAELDDPPPLDLRPLYIVMGFFALMIAVFWSLAN